MNETQGENWAFTEHDIWDVLNRMALGWSNQYTVTSQALVWIQQNNVINYM